mmetsp:Transcript_24423/g.56915  ORF Transcript_24423/g.56915 Transcript_24423/m.56915 type:complete len:85 (-) Transcript_24423:2364-2618(-)
MPVFLSIRTAVGQFTPSDKKATPTPDNHKLGEGSPLSCPPCEIPYFFGLFALAPSPQNDEQTRKNFSVHNTVTNQSKSDGITKQ